MTEATKYKVLEFSYNWNNKIDCKFFTTLRKSGRFEKGDAIDITLKNTHKKYGVISDKKKIKYKDINNFIAGVDTGYTVKETQGILDKMYKGTNWDVEPLYLYLIRSL